MTQDEIIEMARQAGMALENYGGTLLVRHLPSDSYGGTFLVRHLPSDSLEAFAKLVAAKERELCAQICEKQDWYGTGDYQFGYEHGVKNCVDAIRDLGE